MGRGKIAGLVRLLAVALLAAAFPAPAEEVTYRNTKPGVPYVGSRVCAGCHAKIFQQYSATAMGRSMDVAASRRRQQNINFAGTVFDEHLNRHFEVFARGQDLFQAEYELDPNGQEVFRTTHQLEYVIGTGVNGLTYLVRRGDYLFEAPLSYYSRKPGWGLSPGYESVDYGFNRPVAAACVACHSGRPQPVRGREGLFATPPFVELAIGCENCHGPGGLHIAERTRQNGATIVNPRKLPSRLAEDICMNCHQGGDTRVLVPGKDYSDFRPGTPLAQTLAILRIPLKRDAPGNSDLLEHHFSMQLSKCYRANNGRLSCLTCHQIHSMPPPSDAVSYYRSRCLSCHQSASCKEAKTRRLENGDNCIACHMPKRNVQLIAHSALTNHRIIAKPDEPLPEAAFLQTTPELPDLVYLNHPAGSDRSGLAPTMLLQAYGELMDREPRYRNSYFALLDTLSKTAPNEPLVQAALGRKALLEGTSLEDAIEHLKKAIQLGFKAATAFQDLADALVRSGREADAVPVLRRGIELAPYTPVLYKMLALRFINLKQYSEARHTMERYVDLFPEDDFMRGLLRKVQPH